MSLQTNVSNFATRVATEVKSLRVLVNGNVVDLSGLSTAAKGNLVVAINELVTKVGQKADASSLSAVAISGDAGDLTGTLPASALPPLSIVEVFVVDSEAEMLALTAQRGDVAKRTDTGLTYILAVDSPEILSSWVELTSADAVASVAGKTGHVVLVKSDVGLDRVNNTNDLEKPISTATATALAGKQDAHALLSAFSGLLLADGDFIRATGPNSLGKITPSSLGVDLLTAVNAAAARTSLDVYSKTEIGSVTADFVATFEAGLV